MRAGPAASKATAIAIVMPCPEAVGREDAVVVTLSVPAEDVVDDNEEEEAEMEEAEMEEASSAEVVTVALEEIRGEGGVA